jgi:hypothetical protein
MSQSKNPLNFDVLARHPQSSLRVASCRSIRANSVVHDGLTSGSMRPQRKECRKTEAVHRGPASELAHLFGAFGRNAASKSGARTIATLLSLPTPSVRPKMTSERNALADLIWLKLPCG